MSVVPPKLKANWRSNWKYTDLIMPMRSRYLSYFIRNTRCMCELRRGDLRTFLESAGVYFMLSILHHIHIQGDSH